MDDDDSNERYYKSLMTQDYHSKFNAYDCARIPPHEDEYSTESETSVRITVVKNSK